jgi:Protein of unknown function (DUF2568)
MNRMPQTVVSSPLVAFGLTLQFLLELAVLGGLGHWGSSAAGSKAAQLALAAAAPLAAAVLWSIFGSPRAPLHLEGASRLLLEAAFFGAGATGLVASGQTFAGAILAAVAAANIALLNALGHG